ncbi:dihydrodipicolinate synthase family protein [Saccharopolyspora pogona]|uniref:dihydrodipicolinate synthase family protein n=1 Tax=Saccharopolyspora pogona TaxID=333966 RepID=UPI0016849FDB|nr:dihydrodipicolinate synthase family protein [Saccharopolyspora pogona]
MNLTLDGVLAFPATPMDNAGDRLDLNAYESLLGWLSEGGVHGIIPLGSTGEFAYLDPDERHSIAEATVKTLSGQVPAIIGVSAVTTRDAVAYARHAQDIGADGVMLSIPTYYALGAEQVLAHVQAVASSTELPLILYNNPFTSQVDLTTDLLEKLVENPTLVAVKEATMDVNRIPLIQQTVGDRLEVLGGGFDPYALPAFVAGARGWTTGMANLVPRLCVQLHQAAVQDRDLDRAQQLDRALAPLANLLVNNNLSAAVKCGLRLIGRPAGAPRPPLQPVGPEVEEQLRTALAALDQA